MHAAIYLRVSTEDQTQGYSLDSQLRALRSLAKQRGYAVVMEETDDQTGSNLDRPGLTKIRDAARAHTIQRILCFDPDRMSRVLWQLGLIHEECEQFGCRIEYVKELDTSTPEGQLMFNVLGSFAQWERQKIRERTMRGRREKAKQGRIVGGPVPFGYTCTKGKIGGELRIDLASASIVKEIFERAAAGQSIRAITKWLNTTDARPIRGGAWQKSTVHRILSNETYSGQVWYFRRKRVGAAREYRDQSEWIPIPAPFIVSRDLFAIVADRMSANRTMLAGRPSATYLLRGLMVCAACGKRFGGQKTHGRRSYRCNGRCVESVQLDATRSETAAWRKIAETYSDADALRRQVSVRLAEMREQRGSQSNEKLEQRAQLLRKREERIVRLLMDSSVSDHERLLRTELATCRQQREQAERAIAALASQADVLASVDVVVRSLRSVIGKAEGDDGRRQEVLRRLVGGIQVTGRLLKITCKLSTPLARCGQFEITVNTEVA